MYDIGLIFGSRLSIRSSCSRRARTFTNVSASGGRTPDNSNFPPLLRQAFVAVELTEPEHPKLPGEPALSDFDRALFSFDLAVNRLRNLVGTGHGRPWLPAVKAADARCAVEAMGIIAERLLTALAGVR